MIVLIAGAHGRLRVRRAGKGSDIIIPHTSCGHADRACALALGTFELGKTIIYDDQPMQLESTVPGGSPSASAPPTIRASPAAGTPIARSRSRRPRAA
jgi:hypothetical protein